jgi:hypothetical protein
MASLQSATASVSWRMALTGSPWQSIAVQSIPGIILFDISIFYVNNIESKSLVITCKTKACFYALALCHDFRRGAFPREMAFRDSNLGF